MTYPIALLDGREINYQITEVSQFHAYLRLLQDRN